MRGVNGVTISMIIAIGNRRIAVSSAENPSTSWKYCVMSSITPYMARKTSIMAPLPTLNAGFAEVVHVEHRLVGVQLPEHERGEHHRAQGERAQRGGRRPPGFGRLDESEHDRRHADDRQQRTDRIDPALVGVA